MSPRILFAVLAAFLALSPAIFWYELTEPFEPIKAALAQLAALTILVAAGWRWADLRRLFAGPVGVWVAVGVGVTALSAAFSISPRLSLLGDVDSHDGLGHAVALAVIFAAARTAGGGALAWSLLGLAAACGYALAQMAGLDPLRWSFVSEFSAWDRPAGTLGHPSYLGGYAVMALPLLAWFAAEGGWRTRIVAALLAVAAGVVVVATLSRAPWLAGAAAAVVMLALWPVRRKLLWCGGLLTAGALVAVVACLTLGDSFLSSLQERLGGLTNSSGRWPVWQAAWRIFLEHPLLGSGTDTFGPAFASARTPVYWQIEWGLMPRRAHDDFLHALATKGAAGGVAYLGLAAALALACVRAWRHQPERRRLVAALAGVAVAFYVQNIFGFAVAATAGLFAAMCGVVASLADKGEVASSPRSRLLPALLALPLAWLILAPILAGYASRRGDAEPAWHDTAVKLAPWHDVFHSRRSVAALREAEREPTAEGRLARLKAARESAAEACRLMPCRAIHNADLGRASLELARAGQAKPAEVLAAFDRSFVLDGCDSVAFADAARAATSLGEIDLAERYAERGLAADPNFAALHAERGAAMLTRATRTTPPDANLLTRAVETLRDAQSQEWHGDLDRLDRARLVLALALLHNGHADEARSWAGEVRRRRDNWAAAGWLYGVVLERLGLREEALGEYLVVLRTWPDNAQAVAGAARLRRP